MRVGRRVWKKRKGMGLGKGMWRERLDGGRSRCWRWGCLGGRLSFGTRRRMGRRLRGGGISLEVCLISFIFPYLSIFYACLYREGLMNAG